MSCNCKGLEPNSVDLSCENTIKYVCVPCGKKHLSKEQLKSELICTFHIGKCDLCNSYEMVTHVRNYNYLKK
jgi:hypothetical protein